MNKEVTLKAVAESAGVGLTTASLVLNGKADRYRIGPTTQERVRAAARQLGYKPNTVAQRMALGLDITPAPTPVAMPAMATSIQPQGRQIGLVLSATTKPEALALIPSLEPTLTDAGYQLVVVTLPTDPTSAKERMTQLLAGGVAGFLACPTTYMAVSELAAGKCPVIVLYQNAAMAVIQAIERPDSAPPAPVTGNVPSVSPPPVAEPSVVTPPVVPRPSPVAAPVPPPVAKPVAEPPVAPVPPPAPAQPAERPTAEPASDVGIPEPAAPAPPTTEQPDNSTTNSPAASEPEPVVPIEPVPADVADDDSTVTELAQEPVPETTRAAEVPEETMDAGVPEETSAVQEEPVVVPETVIEETSVTNPVSTPEPVPVPEIPSVPEVEPASTQVAEAAPVVTPPVEPAIVEQPAPTPTPAVVAEDTPAPAPDPVEEKPQAPAPVAPPPAPTPVVEEPQVTPPAPVQPAPEPLPVPIPVLVEDPVGTPEQVAVEASEQGLPGEESEAETPKQADEAKPSGAVDEINATFGFSSL